MSNRHRLHYLVFFQLLTIGLAAAIIGGCDSPRTPVIDAKHLENIDSLMRGYQAALEGLGHPPKNEAELKPYLEKIGDPQAILISVRDGAPFEIQWGVDPREPISTDPANPLPALIAYEKKGADGERYIATGFGVMKLPEAQFQKDYGAALAKENSK